MKRKEAGADGLQRRICGMKEMLETDRYLENLYKKNVPNWDFHARTPEEWQTWREGLKERFIRIMGGFPTRKTDLNPRVIEEKVFDSYIRQRIVYTTDEELHVPAYLLIPKNAKGKLPAVIACHGHGYGSREIVGLKPDGSENEGDPGYQKNFALELVKRGFLVIAPDLFGFGDRRLKEDREKSLEQSSCDRVSTFLLMLGKTTAGVRVWDIIRTVDYLTTRDDVDPERIGCMGISGGGLVCGFATAVDERIKASVVSGYVNTFRDSVMAMHHCVDNFLPAMLDAAEMPSIIGLIAPRPLLIEAGTRDPIFPILAVRKAYALLESIYGVLGEEEKLDIDIFEGDHQISGRKAYAWFERWLG
jgi:dienelactone hydrolase